VVELVLLEPRDLRLAHDYLLERFQYDDEPMPPWEDGDDVLLETCRACIEVAVFGEEKYPEFTEKTAKLFYSTIKLHPFSNGNKRFGVVLTLVFVLKNGHTVEAEPGALLRMATRVADADPHKDGTRPDEVIGELTEFFEARVKLDERQATG